MRVTLVVAIVPLVWLATNMTVLPPPLPTEPQLAALLIETDSPDSRNLFVKIMPFSVAVLTSPPHATQMRTENCLDAPRWKTIPITPPRMASIDAVLRQRLFDGLRNCWAMAANDSVDKRLKN